MAHRTEEVTLSKFKHFTGQVGTDLEGQDASVRHSLSATSRQARLSNSTLAGARIHQFKCQEGLGGKRKIEAQLAVS